MMFSGENNQNHNILLYGSMLQLLQWDRSERVLQNYDDIHEHDYWQCNWGLRSSADVVVGKQTKELNKWDMIFIPPHTPHKIIHHNRFLSLSFKFHTNLLAVNELLFVSGNAYTKSIITAADILVRTMFPLNRQSDENGIFIDAESHYHHTIEYLLAGVINVLILDNDPLPEPAGSLRRMLRNSGGVPLSVSEAAERCALSRNHLCNLVKASVNMSAKNFIDQERAFIASQYLKFSDMNIAEISDRMQFPTSGHFCKFFRRMTGMTPGGYRRRMVLPAKESRISGKMEI